MDKKDLTEPEISSEATKPKKARVVRKDPAAKKTIKLSPLQARLLIRMVAGRTFGWSPADSAELGRAVEDLIKLAKTAYPDEILPQEKPGAV